MGFIGDLFSSPTQPAAVNPQQMIGAQTAANTETARLQARLNRPDTYTPFGSVTYEDVGDDRWRTDQTFSPEMQSLFDIQMSTGQGLGEAALSRVGMLPGEAFSLEGMPGFRSEIDYSGITGIPGADDFGGARRSAEEASFGRVWDRMDPYFSDEERGLETKLENRGIPRGTVAFDREMQKFNQRKDDAITAAGYDAVAAGRDAYSDLFGQAMTSRQQGISEQMGDINLANIGRQQGISDMLLERTQPMNELAALLQGAPAISTPQPVPTAGVGVSPPDVGGAYGMAQGTAQSNYAQQMAQRNAGMSGAFGLGSAAALMM